MKTDEMLMDELHEEMEQEKKAKYFLNASAFTVTGVGVGLTLASAAQADWRQAVVCLLITAVTAITLWIEV